MKVSTFCRPFSVFLSVMFLAAGILFARAFYVQAQEAAEKKDPPVHVTSDRMVAEKTAKLVTFTGNVVAERENSSLSADKVKIYFAENTKNGDTQENSGSKEERKSKIEKIIATGNVVYSSDKRKAFADKAVYTAEDETLVLTGEASRLTTENSFIEGEKITLFQKTDQVVVEKGKHRRVNALINPKDTERKE